MPDRPNQLRVLLTIAAVAVVGVAASLMWPQLQNDIQQSDIEKIDVHAHHTYERGYLVPLLDEWKMQAVVVNVARTGEGAWRGEWEASAAHVAKHPDHLFLTTAFDADGIDEPGYVDRVVAQLDHDLEDGATMVKVWKNFGLVSRDADGSYVQIDDERLQPVWDFLAERGVPVLAHIGEPRAAWLPLDTSSPHYLYYKNNPEYHTYQHPEIPRWEHIMAARDRWVERNAELTIIGAHLGSMAYDVDEVAARLDRYPNFYVDTAARFGDLAAQPREQVRDFFVRYSGRILYGTDMGISAPASEVSDDAQADERASMEKMLSLHWQYLAGADSLHFDSPMISFPVDTKSLNLPPEVLRKVYYENAARVLEL